MTAIDFHSLLRAEKIKQKASVSRIPNETNFQFPLTPKPDKITPFQVGTIPYLFYIPNWISREEEQEIVRKIDSKNDTKTWQSLTRRRLKMYGGVPVNHSSGMIPEKIPVWTQAIFDELQKLEVYRTRGKKLNHVLLNEYQEGMGIDAHKDGPLYEDLVAILNLEGTAVMDFFQEKECSTKQSIFLERRSLLLFMGNTYHNYYHAIEEKKFDNIDDNIINCNLSGINLNDRIERGERRLSLTMRIVKFVAEQDLSVPESPQQKEEMKRREMFFYKSISEKI